MIYNTFDKIIFIPILIALFILAVCFTKLFVIDKYKKNKKYKEKDAVILLGINIIVPIFIFTAIIGIIGELYFGL